MLKRSLQITHKLEPQPASRFVKAANQFQSRISLEMDGHRVDGKSMMSVMELANHQANTLTLLVEGEDEATAIEVLGSILEKEIT
ncbi:HPr family phosphocarrier protein [Desulforamulus ferrireducens]|uniref:Phosphocarrier protein HPr n=1 Tax=Desulforamulus ferrireducens TaxID=1833852 RepID=A0A1S6IZV8_9FIRM|nr:HPr family phosphocarrier protein [Desulforamulus ferrireducens]AQS60294.1 HPr family phosphocarrier protein [Desulforamulus ferrireducens]